MRQDIHENAGISLKETVGGVETAFINTEKLIITVKIILKLMNQLKKMTLKKPTSYTELNTKIMMKLNQIQ